jgi:uncharacterized protein YycO
MRVFLILLTATFLSGCFASSGFNFQEKPHHSQLYAISQQLKVGDIIITPKNWKKPLSWLGHSALVIGVNKVGEYPQIYSGYRESDLSFWLSQKQRFKILRYKKFNQAFEQVFLKHVKLSKYKKYGLTNKHNKQQFYCSQYIWQIFYQSAQDLGYKLDIDKDGGYWVSPYDLLNEHYFNEVALNYD